MDFACACSNVAFVFLGLCMLHVTCTQIMEENMQQKLFQKRRLVMYLLLAGYAKQCKATLSYAWVFIVNTYHTADSQEDTMTSDRTIKKFATPHLSIFLKCRMKLVTIIWRAWGIPASRFLPNHLSICKRFTSSLAWFTRKRVTFQLKSLWCIRSSSF